MERLKPLESWICCLTTWKMPVLMPQRREVTRRKTEKILDRPWRETLQISCNNSDWLAATISIPLRCSTFFTCVKTSKPSGQRQDAYCCLLWKGKLQDADSRLQHRALVIYKSSSLSSSSSQEWDNHFCLLYTEIWHLWISFDQGSDVSMWCFSQDVLILLAGNLSCICCPLLTFAWKVGISDYFGNNFCHLYLMVTYFKVIIILYFYLYRLIENYPRKCIYEALPDINTAVWYLYADGTFYKCLDFNLL